MEVDKGACQSVHAGDYELVTRAQVVECPVEAGAVRGGATSSVGKAAKDFFFFNAAICRSRFWSLELTRAYPIFCPAIASGCSGMSRGSGGSVPLDMH